MKNIYTLILVLFLFSFSKGKSEGGLEYLEKSNYTKKITFKNDSNLKSINDNVSEYFNYNTYFRKKLSNDTKNREQSSKVVKKQVVKLHPNPVRDILTINIDESLELTQIKVFNVIGKEVASAFDTSKVDLGSLEKGLYLLEIKTKKEVFYKKIIKK